LGGSLGTATPHPLGTVSDFVLGSSHRKSLTSLRKKKD